MENVVITHGKNGWIIKIKNYKWYADDYLSAFGYKENKKYTKHEIEEMVKLRLNFIKED